MKAITLLLTTISLMVLMALPCSAAGLQSTSQSAQDVCNGVGDVSGSSGCDATGSTSDLNGTIALVVNILSVIVGIAAVVVLIISGLRFILSGGESSNIASAKDSIIYALVGLLIVVLAQAIVHFVLYHASAQIK